MGVAAPDAGREYHLLELAIATDPSSKHRVMPPLEPGHRRVLDIGCGAGQTLIAADLDPDALPIGLDVDLSALRLGRQWTEGRIPFVCAQAEQLPFRRGYFDLVISRVALPYTDVPRALSQIATALKPGGEVWLVLHPLRLTLEILSRHLRRREIKGVVFQLYVLINGFLLHAFGRTFRFPLGRPRFESFQSRAGMQRSLTRAGFRDIVTHEGGFFVIGARKR